MKLLKETHYDELQGIVQNIESEILIMTSTTILILNLNLLIYKILSEGMAFVVEYVPENSMGIGEDEHLRYLVELDTTATEMLVH